MKLWGHESKSKFFRYKINLDENLVIEKFSRWKKKLEYERRRKSLENKHTHTHKSIANSVGRFFFRNNGFLLSPFNQTSIKKKRKSSETHIRLGFVQFFSLEMKFFGWLAVMAAMICKLFQCFSILKNPISSSTSNVTLVTTNR